MLIPSASNVEITPAMLTVLWGIAHEIDRLRLPANYGDAKWLEIPTRLLRNPEGKTDNQWLRVCLKRLTAVQLEGEYQGDEWGAVMIAQWEIIEGGTLARVLVPPAAIEAISAPKTFAKIEITAAYRLKGHARRLYAALADKKHMGKPHWEYPLDELRGLFEAGDKYARWVDFNRYVLKPALAEVNDFGTVTVKAKPLKMGRSVRGVRFDWKWKDIREAVETDSQNERHSDARRKGQITNDAPPLTDDAKQSESDKAEYREWLKENPRGTFLEFYDQKHSA